MQKIKDEGKRKEMKCNFHFGPWVNESGFVELQPQGYVCRQKDWQLLTQSFTPKPPSSMHTDMAPVMPEEDQAQYESNPQYKNL